MGVVLFARLFAEIFVAKITYPCFLAVDDPDSVAVGALGLRPGRCARTPAAQPSLLVYVSPPDQTADTLAHGITAPEKLLVARVAESLLFIVDRSDSRAFGAFPDGPGSCSRTSRTQSSFSSDTVAYAPAADAARSFLAAVAGAADISALQTGFGSAAADFADYLMLAAHSQPPK